MVPVPFLVKPAPALHCVIAALTSRSVAVAPSATVKMTFGVVVVRIFIWPAIVAVLALGVVIHLNDMTGCEGIIGFEVMNSLCP